MHHTYTSRSCHPKAIATRTNAHRLGKGTLPGPAPTTPARPHSLGPSRPPDGMVRTVPVLPSSPSPSAKSTFDFPLCPDHFLRRRVQSPAVIHLNDADLRRPILPIPSLSSVLSFYSGRGCASAPARVPGLGYGSTYSAVSCIRSRQPCTRAGPAQSIPARMFSSRGRAFHTRLAASLPWPSANVRRRYASAALFDARVSMSTSPADSSPIRGGRHKAAKAAGLPRGGCYVELA
ncbi:hypothetical protein BD413DRAFT_45622 [Trametes elegans]|nr:hypothetical protein BD413DRAFT_45622 [Trametes elegans]